MNFHLARPDDQSEEAYIAKNLCEEYIQGKLRQVIKKNGELFFVEAVNPYCESCLWDPKVTEKVSKHYVEAHHTVKNPTITIHRYDAPVLFKPSVFEIMCQIRGFMGRKKESDLDSIHGFRIESNDKPINEWTSLEHEAMQQGFHIGFLHVYQKLSTTTGSGTVLPRNLE